MMATQNNSNNASYRFVTTASTIDPGASGDSYTQLQLATVNKWRMGIDDDDSDSFKISSGGALGTNDCFVMHTNGSLTYPLQPAFLATFNAENNVTGDSTAHSLGSVAAATIIVNRSGSFYQGDGAGTPASFTAPVTGRYLLVFSCYFTIDPTGGTFITTRINTSNRNYDGFSIPTRNQVANFYYSSGALRQTFSVIADMDQGDIVQWLFTSSGGAKADDMTSGGYCSGFLLA